MLLLLLLTPVLYPAPRSGLGASIASLNPLTPLVTSTRDWLTIGASSHAAGLFAMMLIALVCLLVGWVVLRVAMPHLVARIGS